MREQVIGSTGRPVAGWVAELFLVDIAHVLDVPSGDDSLVADNGFPFSADAHPIQVKFSFRTCSFQETPADTEAGMVYTLALEALVSGQAADLLDWAAANQRRRWLALWRDSNNSGFAAGDAGNGLRLTLERAISAQNFCRLRLSGRSWHSAWRLPDGEIDTLIPYSQIVYDYNTDNDSQ